MWRDRVFAAKNSTFWDAMAPRGVSVGRGSKAPLEFEI